MTAPVPAAGSSSAPVVVVIHPDREAASVIREAIEDAAIHPTGGRLPARGAATLASAGDAPDAPIIVHRATRLGLADPDLLRSADVLLLSDELSDPGATAVAARARELGVDAAVVGVLSPVRWRRGEELLAAGFDDVVVADLTSAAPVPVVVDRLLAERRLQSENRRLHEDLTRSLVELELNNSELERIVRQLERTVRTDALTGLANRRWLDASLAGAWAESCSDGTPVGFIMIDLDGFKQLNDTAGHQAGDDALVRTARVIESVVGDAGLSARCGGDEFCVLLPQTDADTTIRCAQLILEAFRVEARRHVAGRVSLGMSIGVAHSSLSKPRDQDALVRHADEAMYAVKARDGGDGVMVHRGATPSRAAG